MTRKNVPSIPSACAILRFTYLTRPLPWASVHWLVQCTLECHWNATGWSSVHWDTTRRPTNYLQGTLERHWKKIVETAPHWNATGDTLLIFAYTGTPVEKLSWDWSTLGCHWRNSNFAAYTGTPLGEWNSPHTPRHIKLNRVASMPVWNDKMKEHQSASGQVSVNSAFTWSLLLCNGYQFCS